MTHGPANESKRPCYRFQPVPDAAVSRGCIQLMVPKKCKENEKEIINAQVCKHFPVLKKSKDFN